MAQGPAQLVDIAVEGVAVAGLVSLPYRYHQFRGVNRAADVGVEAFKYPGFEV